MDPHAQQQDASSETPTALPEALRIQVAAVAAQQVALDEMEIRLEERREALRAQEEQIALHVEEKRRELQLQSDSVQEERARLQLERQEFQQHIERVTGDLSGPQREILAAEQHIHAERRRLAGLQQKLKQRFERHWDAKVQEQEARARAQDSLAAALTEREQQLEIAEAQLRQRRLRFNGDVTLSRQRLQESWDELRRAQFRWKHRRGLERSALRVQSLQLAETAQQMARARAQLDNDQQAWLTQRQALEQELAGVNTRVENQRTALHRHEEPMRCLEQTPLENGQHLNRSSTETLETVVAVSGEAAASPPVPAPTMADPVRIIDLDRLADDLADQRRQVVEAWQRVMMLHQQWHADRAQAAAEIEALAHRLVEQESHLQQREQATAQAAESLQQRHEQLSRAQEQIIGWRAQLRTEENIWESDRARLMDELSSKDAAVEQHLEALSDLRRRWAKRRKHELEQLAGERNALQLFRKDFAQQRLELAERVAAADEEKRILTEKALALEQYREQVMARSGDDAQAQRRLERLRRRWLTHNAEAIRQAARERTALHAELLALEQRHDALERRTAEVATAEQELIEQQTAWEQQQASIQLQHARLQQDLHAAQDQRLVAEQQLATLRDEIDRIAQALLEQPETPLLTMDRAA